MQKLSLYLLKVFTDIPSVLFIDGVPAAKIGREGAALPVGGGELLIQLFPTEGCAAAISRYICLDIPRMNGADGCCELFMTGEGVFELNVRFKNTKCVRSMPFVLTSINIPFERHTKRATVYYDAGYAFALEQDDRVIISAPFNGELSSAEISVHQFGGMRVAAAKGVGKKCDELKIIRAADPAGILIEREIYSFAFVEDRLETVSRIYGTQIKEVFYSGECTPRNIIPAGNSSGEILAALIYAVMCKNEDSAVKMLSPSLLKEVSFSDLRDYLETPKEIRMYKEEARLIYPENNGVNALRVLKAGIKDEKIVNIEEI